MNQETFLKMAKEKFKKRIELTLRKSHDYATDDILSNFKRMANLAETLQIGRPCWEAWDMALLLLMLKIDRLNNLLRNEKKPENESIKDTELDMGNYSDLLSGLIYEGKEGK